MKKHHKISIRLVSIVSLVAILAMQLFPLNPAFAAQITNRSLTLQAGASDGGSKPSGVVNHLFNFSLPSGTSIGSIQFQYCTLAAGVCTMPTGLDTTAATLGSATGAFTGVTLNHTTNGAPYIAKASAATITPGSEVVQLLGVTNPSTVGTFFVRITSFSTTSVGGSAIDNGTVAASTTQQIILSGTMPESLVFCAGANIGVTSSVPDCSTATSGVISFDQLFSPTDTATATSQMAASTNAGAGYAITVNGPTLTSGSNTLVAMTAAALPSHGVSQFGLNLKANTYTTATQTTGFGLEVAVPSNGTNYRGEATAGYNTVNTFKFNPGDVVADSQSGGAGGSDAQIYTVSYIADVPGSQPAGTYTSTLTYICTPTF